MADLGFAVLDTFNSQVQLVLVMLWLALPQQGDRRQPDGLP